MASVGEACSFNAAVIGRLVVRHHAEIVQVGKKDEVTIMRVGFSAIGLTAMLAASGCGANPPTAPSSMAVEISGADATAATTSYPVVTLQSDLTVSPASVTVNAGTPIRMVNNSSRGVRFHSGNCSEFSLMALSPGASKNTIGFKPAGKTCEYFVWEDSTRTRKIFAGQVVVQ